MAAVIKVLIYIISDIVVVLVVGVTAILMRQFCTPYVRGFFRDDESLMHPFRPSTVTSAMLYSIGFILPVVMIIVTKILNTYHPRCNSHPSEPRDRNKWLISCFHIITIFFFGAACTHLLTDIPKYTIGRLRPHFFDVCKPDWNLLNDTSGYIVADNICTGGDLSLIKEARLSFPSGHSSMAIYCALFLILYLQSKLVWKGLPLMRPFIQLIAFSMAFYTCLSRISDYKHHWSDVLAGAVLGAVVAFSAFTCAKTSWQPKDTDPDKNIP